MAKNKFKPTSILIKKDVEGKSIAIIRATWNEEITKNLETNSIKTLLNYGFVEDQIKKHAVPGAFELPWGARRLIDKGGVDGIICLGCVVKGETKHDQYINQAVANGIMQLNLMQKIPVVFGVLTVETHQQAKERSDGGEKDKGIECVHALMHMLQFKDNLVVDKSKIGFGSK